MAPELILAGLAAIANRWIPLAIAWHVLLAAMLAAFAAGWRPSARIVARVLSSMVFSVSAVAWLSENPFNGTTFTMLGLALIWASTRLSSEPVHFEASEWTGAGGALVVFGWTYPHFLTTDSWVAYLYAAPFALLPCPTLALLMGATLLIRDLLAPPWSVILIVASLFYGGTGVFRLGVSLDWALLAGAALLTAAVVRHRNVGRELIRREV